MRLSHALLAFAPVLYQPLLPPLATTTPRAAPVIMGRKGDGKQRRPKASSSPPPPPPPPAESTARSGRITSGGEASHTLSVRKQIRLVKAFDKAARAGPAKPAARTSFRKREKNNTRAGMGDDEKVDVSGVDWNALPILFVDGYNIVNAWPRLKKRFAKGDLLGCREMLLEDVASFTIQRYNTTVVFDASGAAENQGGVGRDRVDEYAGGLVRVVYAHTSADEYIEKRVRELRAEGQSVWTATSDGGIATACNLHGATVVSANWLVTELKAARNAEAAVLADFNKRQDLAAGRQPTLWDALDPALRAQLDTQLEQNRFAGLSRKQREAMEALRASGGEDRGAAARRRQNLEAQRLRRRTKGRGQQPEPRGPADDEPEEP